MGLKFSYLFTKYLYRIPSRYLLRGAPWACLYDFKCHYERIFSISKTRHSKCGHAHTWYQPMYSCGQM